MIPFVLSAACLLVAYLADRRRRVFDDLGISPAGGVSVGQVEVVGRAWHDEPTIERYSGKRCVWIEEREYVERRRVDDDAIRPSRTYHHWTLESHRRVGPSAFQVVDESGAVLVRPEHAEVRPRRVHTDEWGERASRVAHGGSTGRHRREVDALLHGDQVFVSGIASMRRDRIQPQIRLGYPLLLTVSTPQRGASVNSTVATAFGILAVGLAGLGGWVLADETGALIAMATVALLEQAHVRWQRRRITRMREARCASIWQMLTDQVDRIEQLRGALSKTAGLDDAPQPTAWEPTATAAGLDSMRHRLSTHRARCTLAIEALVDSERERHARTIAEIGDAEQRVVALEAAYRDQASYLQSAPQLDLGHQPVVDPPEFEFVGG